MWSSGIEGSLWRARWRGRTPATDPARPRRGTRVPGRAGAGPGPRQPMLLALLVVLSGAAGGPDRRGIMQLDTLAAAERLGQVGFRGLDAEPLGVGDWRDPAAGQHARQRPLPVRGRPGSGRRIGDVRALGEADGVPE